MDADSTQARSSSTATSGLLLLALLVVLYFARAVAVPIAVAFILSLVFAPAVRRLRRAWIPVPLGAGIVVLGLLFGGVGAVYTLTEPAGEWIERAPQALKVIDNKLRRVMGSVQDVATATAKVQDMTKQLAGAAVADKPVREVVVKQPSLAATVFGAARGFAITAISTLVLLYFLLVFSERFLHKTIAAYTRLADRQRAIEIARGIEDAVSTYLFTVTTINLCLGTAVAIALYLLDVPNPLLWGAMVAAFNFVPYLGDIASVTVLTVVGLLTFDDLGRSLLVPGVFYLLTATEGYVVTPLIVGRRLSLNPVVIVLSVMFWGWMWGAPGVLLAVPILVVIKTWCDRVDSLHTFGEFLAA